MKYSLRLGENVSDLQKALELMLSVPHRAIDNKFLASIEGFRGMLGTNLNHNSFYPILRVNQYEDRI